MMTQHRYITARERVGAHRVRKLYEYARTEKSLQMQLLERAVQVAERKGIRFQAGCARWLREVAQRTAARALPVPARGLAFDDTVLLRINQAFAAITRLIEEIVFDVKAGMAMTAASLQAAFERLCPLPPAC